MSSIIYSLNFDSINSCSDLSSIFKLSSNILNIKLIKAFKLKIILFSIVSNIYVYFTLKTLLPHSHFIICSFYCFASCIISIVIFSKLLALPSAFLKEKKFNLYFQFGEWRCLYSDLLLELNNNFAYLLIVTLVLCLIFLDSNWTKIRILSHLTIPICISSSILKDTYSIPIIIDKCKNHNVYLKCLGKLNEIFYNKWFVRILTERYSLLEVNLMIIFCIFQCVIGPLVVISITNSKFLQIIIALLIFPLNIKYILKLIIMFFKDRMKTFVSNYIIEYQIPIIIFMSISSNFLIFISNYFITQKIILVSFGITMLGLNACCFFIHFIKIFIGEALNIANLNQGDFDWQFRGFYNEDAICFLKESFGNQIFVECSIYERPIQGTNPSSISHLIKNVMFAATSNHFAHWYSILNCSNGYIRLDYGTEGVTLLVSRHLNDLTNSDSKDWKKITSTTNTLEKINLIQKWALAIEISIVSFLMAVPVLIPLTIKGTKSVIGDISPKEGSKTGREIALFIKNGNWGRADYSSTFKNCQAFCREFHRWFA